MLCNVNVLKKYKSEPKVIVWTPSYMDDKPVTSGACQCFKDFGHQDTVTSEDGVGVDLNEEGQGNRPVHSNSPSTAHLAWQETRLLCLIK